ncbi:MAG: nucleotidyltransferase domain-containing protein [Proteobacteria bacterium]|jgi:predicted nucleotidyltransferase|nr:nucleotidyltransferase domain-containing protein [Pseudomonadota bacterium]
MNAFITGSRAYGKPNANSDVDLVIRVNTGTAQSLRRLSDNPHSTVVRFGKLNLILCETDEEYAVWKLGTTELIKKLDAATTGKEAAHEIFKELRKRVDVQDIEQS